MTILFISDLHLDPQHPQITAQFLGFLEREARQADALYILGDLFEAWVGDDDDAELPQQIAAALRQVHKAGVPIGFIRGNRDFLLGHDYAAQAGLTLLPDPCVLELTAEATLLLHGDLLCTDDSAYQAFRREVRAPAWQQSFLAQSLNARRAFARQARAQSQALQQSRPLDIGDVNPEAVAHLLRSYGVSRMIHGHTHRPAVHDLTLENRPCQRIVLGDWYEQGSVLRLQQNGQYELSRLSL